MTAKKINWPNRGRNKTKLSLHQKGEDAIDFCIFTLIIWNIHLKEQIISYIYIVFFYYNYISNKLIYFLLISINNFRINSALNPLTVSLILPP